MYLAIFICSALVRARLTTDNESVTNWRRDNWQRELVRNSQMRCNRSVALDIILYSRKNGIIDIVTYVYLAREEVAHIEVGHPTSICTQRITTRREAGIEGKGADKLTLCSIDFYTLNKLTLWGYQLGIDIARGRVAGKQRGVHKVATKVECLACAVVWLICHQIELLEDSSTTVEEFVAI